MVPYFASGKLRPFTFQEIRLCVFVEVMVQDNKLTALSIKRGLGEKTFPFLWVKVWGNGRGWGDMLVGKMGVSE